MQTFLPHESFEASAAVLDRARLGKQRVEALQILKALAGESNGWVNHPAVLMWRGYERALIKYALAIINEWRDRGYRDSCLEQLDRFLIKWQCRARRRPLWLGNRDFHLAHRSNLIRKDPEHYTRFWPNVPSDLEYVWPEPLRSKA